MNRKQFVNTITGASIGFFPLKYEDKNLPLESMAIGSVKIRTVKPYIFSNALYIKIETDAGINGWGEGDHENTNIIGKFIEEVFNPLLIGENPFDSEYLWHQLFFEGFEN
jgi:L-alanine-DL-glutamate epimerase-like enolase superfamily enzyme